MLTERTAAWASLVPGLALSIAFAPKDAWFLPNFQFYFFSQMAVVGIVALARPRGAVISGSALALALYFGAFATWVFTRTRPDGLIWLGYIFVVPAALAGILIGALWLRSREPLSGPKTALASAVAALVALGLGQIAVCSTLFHCSL